MPGVIEKQSELNLLNINTSQLSSFKNILSNKAVMDRFVPKQLLSAGDSVLDDGIPFYVFNIDDVVFKCQQWAQLMPRVRPYYAVKCNDDENVIKLIANAHYLIDSDVLKNCEYQSFGFDCASRREIDQVLQCTLPTDFEPSDRIIFANPCKVASHVKFAKKSDVRMTTFDSAEELRKLARLYPDAKLLLRLKVDEKGAQCELGSKYGTEFEQVRPLLELAIRLNLNVVGVSFHVGSGCRDATAYSDAIALASKAFKIGRILGLDQMELLDIGGGFPGHKFAPLTFDHVASYVRNALDEHFPIERGVKIIAEPGRYFVASAFRLYVEIVGKKYPHENDTQQYMYYVNDGVYGSFNCLLYDHAEVFVKTIDECVQSQLINDDDDDETTSHKSTIFGPTCDGLDKIMQDVEIRELEIGDWLLFEDMGAYTIAAASTFNGFPRPNVNLACSDELHKVLIAKNDDDDEPYELMKASEEMSENLIKQTVDEVENKIDDEDNSDISELSSLSTDSMSY